VNLYELPPKTTYYYTVESMDSSGRSDGVKSPIKSFTTLSSDQAMAVSPPAARSTAKMRPSIQ
jgi:hypothetical protein